MIRVSVIEDRIDTLNSLVKNIDRAEGMLCISSYTNAEDALKKILSDKPNIVLMDIGLPRMDGISCMIKLKSQNSDIHFLMYTVFDDEKLFDALKGGASGYVLKSDGIRGVIQAIKDLSKGFAPMSGTIATKVISSFYDSTTKKKLGFEHLTNREYEILVQISKGFLNKEIADLYNITEGTVKQHNYNIYKKLGVNNRAEVIAKYLKGMDKQ